GADGGVDSRSEGLAVASYELYVSGQLGGSPRAPRADVPGLTGLTAASLARAFQVSAANPLTGLEGRAALLRRLGDVVALAPEYFGSSELARLGGLRLGLKHSALSGRLAAGAIVWAL